MQKHFFSDSVFLPNKFYKMTYLLPTSFLIILLYSTLPGFYSTEDTQKDIKYKPPVLLSRVTRRGFGHFRGQGFFNGFNNFNPFFGGQDLPGLPGGFAGSGGGGGGGGGGNGVFGQFSNFNTLGSSGLPGLPGGFGGGGGGGGGGAPGQPGAPGRRL